MKKKFKLTPMGIVLIVIAALAAVALILGAIYVISVVTDETIYPNVYAVGIDLGGMTEEQAADAIENYVTEQYGAKGITIQLPDCTAEFTPEQLGVHLDTERMVTDAFAYGRTGNIISRVILYTRAKRAEGASYTVSAGVSSSEEAVRARAEALAAELHRDMKPSAMEVRTEENKILVTIGTTGLEVDSEALCAAVRQAVLNNDFEDPIVIDYLYAPYPALDLTATYQELHRDVSDAYYDVETKEIVDEQVGYGFDLIAANQKIAMAQDGAVLTVELEEIQPAETRAHLEEIYFADELGTCSTSGLGGSNRVTNITLVCKTINGYVLAPGETFSYNGAVGQRTKEKGYKEAGAYANGEHVTEIGGGICQVSSTLYYAALKANLKIVSRTAHMFPVAYLPKGLDATVSWGGPDFQFRNNTDYPIRIEAKVEGGYCKIRLLGTKTDDTYVKMRCETLQTFPYTTTFTDDPKKVRSESAAHDGYYVVTYRQLYGSDDKLISETIEDYSSYEKEDIVVLQKEYDKALEEERRRQEEERAREEEEQRLREEEERRQQEEQQGDQTLLGKLLDQIF